MAMQMFKKTGNESPAVSGSSSRLDGWLTMLDRVRMDQCRDVDLLERALRYGLELSPLPKETWHLARAMTALTDDPGLSRYSFACPISGAGQLVECGYEATREAAMARD